MAVTHGMWIHLRVSLWHENKIWLLNLWLDVSEVNDKTLIINYGNQNESGSNVKNNTDPVFNIWGKKVRSLSV